MLRESAAPGVGVLGSSPAVLRVLGVEDHHDYSSWLGAWRQCADGDVFSHPAYLAERAGTHTTPRAVAFTDGRGSQVLYAFLQRPITHDACGNAVPEGCYDLTTPLLYGGPLCSIAEGAEESSVMTAFWDRFRPWARSEGIISEFHRINPVTGGVASYPGTWREQAPHVVKRVGGKTYDELLLDASKDFRRKIRRTREAGLELRVDETGDDHDVFLHLYYETMRRRCADARFFYDHHFFTMMHETFEGQITYLFAIAGGRPVSAEMALFCGETGYAFLGATEASSLATGANSFLSHHAFLYAQSRGVKNYVLTGGVTNTEDDSLLRFKLSTAKTGRRDYFTAHQVIDDERYARLSACNPESTFFPAYRAEGTVCSGRCSGGHEVRS